MKPKNTDFISNTNRWWGSFDIPENIYCSWKIDLFRLAIIRRKFEWSLTWYRDKEPSDPLICKDFLGHTEPRSEDAEHARFVHSTEETHFGIGLLLADRPIVARPETLIFVPPGQHTTLYVGSGLWLQPNLNGQVLTEIPIFRPSDTWFGENTREGELCYFSKTRARTNATDSIISPHRAVTPITVTNRSNKSIKIERIRVPVVNLGLYLTEQGHFVTNSLSMILNESTDKASMEIIPMSKIEGEFELISPPRTEPDSGLLNQTIAKFLG